MRSIIWIVHGGPPILPSGMGGGPLGNENPEVMIKQFVTKGTFDAYLWQIQEQKLRYIKQILTGRSIARS